MVDLKTQFGLWMKNDPFILVIDSLLPMRYNFFMASLFHRDDTIILRDPPAKTRGSQPYPACPPS
jgi:hypothetical protein